MVVLSAKIRSLPYRGHRNSARSWDHGCLRYRARCCNVRKYVRRTRAGQRHAPYTTCGSSYLVRLVRHPPFRLSYYLRRHPLTMYNISNNNTHLLNPTSPSAHLRTHSTTYQSMHPATHAPTCHAPDTSAPQHAQQHYGRYITLSHWDFHNFIPRHPGAKQPGPRLSTRGDSRPLTYLWVMLPRATCTSS